MVQHSLERAELETLVHLLNSGQFGAAESMAIRLSQISSKSLIVWKVLGVALAEQGKLAQAVTAMINTVKLAPKDAEAHRNLAIALSRLGQTKSAEMYCRKAIKLNAVDAHAQNCLADVLNQLNKFKEAQRASLKAIELSPDMAEAYINLANSCRFLGQTREAEDYYRRALEIEPAQLLAYTNLASLLCDNKQLAEAKITLEKALTLAPNNCQLYVKLAKVLDEMALKKEAEATLLNALQINAKDADTLSSLAFFYHSHDNIAEAQRYYELSLAQNPNSAICLTNLAMCLQSLKKSPLAEQYCRKAIELNPNLDLAYNTLGVVLTDLRKNEEAEHAFLQAIKLTPNFAEAHNNLAKVYKETNQISEAVRCYQTALHFKPSLIEAWTNLLFSSLFYAKLSPEQNFEQAKQFGQIVASTIGEPYQAWNYQKIDATKDDKIKIGFVSGDFKRHSVSYFLLDLIRELNKTTFELIAYTTQLAEDDMTALLKPHFSKWQTLFGKSDKEAAALIHNDGVHILIDLAGHTDNNRLPVFAYKPAPVQVTWLGYPATTGLSEIDYILGDPYLTPPEDDHLYVEQVWRLPQIVWSFNPLMPEPTITPTPALQNQYVTFGCFNNIIKISDQTVATWAKILSAVPNAKLHLQARHLSESLVKQQTLERFAAHGISAERLILDPSGSREYYFDSFKQIDIALDPFPCPGGTTSADTAWMGVPILTLKGRNYSSRIGETIVNNIGLPEWVATDIDDYIEKAIALASDIPALAQLKQQLRQQVLNSPLCDAKQFSQHFAQAMKAMLERHNTSSDKTGNAI